MPITQGLEELIQRISRYSEARGALIGVGSHTNFTYSTKAKMI